MKKKLATFFVIIFSINSCIFVISDSLDLTIHFLTSIFFTLNYLIIILLRDIRLFLTKNSSSKLNEKEKLTAEDHPIIKSARERLGKKN